MKVFISWSGDRSQTIAQALLEWLPLVIHGVEPWLSKADIAAGERWSQSIAKELEACNFGILCVTRENVGSPWILFKAGSLAKSLESSRVIPLLFDLDYSEISGPLAQFQAKKTDKENLSDVVQSVNGVLPQPIPEAHVKALFEALWPKLEGKLAGIPKHPPSGKPIRPQIEVLEELVSGIRALELRSKGLEEMVVASSDTTRNGRSGRMRRFHPMMMRELSYRIGGPDDPIALLIFASVFKDDFPWIYELGVETYQTLRKGRSSESRAAVRRFRNAMESIFRGPFAEEFGPISKEVFMAFREMEAFLMIRGEEIMDSEKMNSTPQVNRSETKREQ